MGHSDSMVTLVGVAPSAIYNLLGQGGHNFPADWHRLGLVDRAWIGLASAARRDPPITSAPIDEDDDWPMDHWVGL